MSKRIRGVRIYGLDFTSRPRKAKPITCAACELRGAVLHLDSFRDIPSFAEFEAFLNQEGEWIAALDLPFGQPRRLIENLGWPRSWPEYVKRIAGMTREEFFATLHRYREGRLAGDKQHLREIDRRADSRSPMMLYGVPVGKMFFEGAPRLLASEANIVPCRPAATFRTVVEGYPALVARRAIGKRSYKSDTKRKQTQAHREARRGILQWLRSDAVKEAYGFSVPIPDGLAEALGAEPGADRLDALLCAAQAAWAHTQREDGYGSPPEADPVEGWIVDPSM